jgi:flagellar biosynthesis protein FlhG
MTIDMHKGQAIAITSGKGGVGKTNIAVNLALALCKLGKRVVLFDADLSLSNAYILMGLSPRQTIVDALEADLSLSQVCTDGPLGLKLISGGSGLNELMNMSAKNRHRIIRSLRELSTEFDYLVVDTAAGIEDNVLDFVFACNRVLVVVVGEPAAFIDAYACIKVLSQFGRVMHFDVVVNLARDEAHGKDVFKRFKGIVDRFLTANLYHAATIPEDEHLLASVNNCVPPIVSAPDSRASLALELLGNMIAGPHATPINEDDDMFFARESIVPQGAIQ